MTRLADLTGLDCLGVPVFQAVRPWSRALSVHQGKGLTSDGARMGAYMEAVESAHAEAFAAPARRGPFHRLAATERAACVADFAGDRAFAPTKREPVDWVAARRLTDGGVVWVPFEVVSLDFERPADDRFDRSSNGLGAHFDAEAATLKGLYEVIERDAHAAWNGLSLGARSLRRLDARSIPLDWFKQIRHRTESKHLTLNVYQMPAIVPLPALLTEILEPAAGCAPRAGVYGMAVHNRAEQALLGAVLEAIQARVTVIAGAREDIAYHAPSGGMGVGFGLPLPPGMAARSWRGALDGWADDGRVTASRLALHLARQGYPDVAAVDLSRPGFHARVVKVVAPGLGAFDRTRRRVERAA